MYRLYIACDFIQVVYKLYTLYTISIQFVYNLYKLYRIFIQVLYNFFIGVRDTVSPNVLITLYYGEFYSNVLFSILFWGSSHHATNIFKIQKRAVRLMAKEPYNAPCRPIFRKLNILPIPCIYILSAVIYIHRNLSSFSKNRDFHHHFTRSHNDLHVDYARTTKCLHGLRRMGIVLHNHLPLSFKSLNDKSFKRQVKDLLLNKLYYNVNEFLADPL